MSIVTYAKEIDPVKTGMTRKDVMVGDVFRKVGGTAIRAAIGENGSPYSFNLSKERVDWSSGSDYPVEVVGNYTWKVTLCPNEVLCGDPISRDEVAIGEVFRGKDKGRIYVHLGLDKDGRVFSAILNGTGNHAVSDNTERMVTVIGEAKLDVTLSGKAS